MAITSHKLLCLGPHGFHRTAYRQWSNGGQKPHLVCVHGLTRNSHDFNRFAAELQHDYTVTCPDVVGRGRSDWLPVKTDYGYPQYTADMSNLVARLDTDHVDWVGTSMGGLIGIMLAAQPNTPIRKLVLNDIGPQVPKALVERIMTYLGVQPTFQSLLEAKEYLRNLYQGFGPLDEEQWLEVAINSTYQKRDGTYSLAYDPGIAEPWRGQEPRDQDLWGFWDNIRCPVLVLRGVTSDCLTADIAAEMVRRANNTVEVIEVEDTGHTPPLMDPRQIQKVRDWLVS